MTTSIRWRTVDIVIASTIGVAFGVVFWAWWALWHVTEAAFTAFQPGQAILYGMWLMPAVLAALIIRKPGAALYAQTVAATLSAIIGNTWGASVIPQGLVEGFTAELAFLFVMYRVFALPIAVLSGALGGVGATVFDAIVWYPGTSWATFRLPYIGIGTLSCAVIAGVGAWALVRALAQTGTLDRFAAGRERAAV